MRLGEIILKKFRQLLGNISPTTMRREPLSDRTTLSAERFVLPDGRILDVTVGASKDVLNMVEIEKECYNGKVPWNASSLFQDINNNKNALYIMVRDGRIGVGFIGAWFSGDEAHVTNVAVIPSYQGKGIGTFLMKQMEEVAIKENKTFFSLEVRVSNKKAITLYEKLGYEAVKIKKRYYKPDQEDALEMKLDLKGVNNQENG